MSNAEKIRKIDIGDIFHATSSSGRMLDCLVIDKDIKYLYCHRVTTAEYFVFNRRSGISIGDDTESSVIDSVEPLPRDIHNVLVALYRRYQKLSSEAEAALSRAEIEALLFLHDFYPAHPL